MKIAILSDIHGNSVALKEVLKEIEKLNINKIYVLGDMIGYYYHSYEVFEYLSKFDVDFLKGNHEDLLLKALEEKDLLVKITAKYGCGIKFTIDKMSKKFCDMLRLLPYTKTVTINNIKIAFCHGSLEDVNEYIYPDADIKVLNHYASYDYDFIFMGHTHYPFVFSNNNTVIVNAGSVGQARDKGGVASWCVLDLINRIVVCKHTMYDPRQIIMEVKRINPKIEYLYKVLER